MELVYHDNINRFDILKMFESFDQCRKDFPVESCSEDFFCGNTGAGKSSLAAVIMERAKKPPNYEFDTSDPIPVDLLTTGINYPPLTEHNIESLSEQHHFKGLCIVLVTPYFIKFISY